MKIIESKSYRTILTEIEHEGKSYSVTFEETIIQDYWTVVELDEFGDGERMILPTEELHSEIVEFCKKSLGIQ